jgi:acyl dehydratase
VQFGRYYEEFEVGAVYKHWPGKTVTEYDDHLFCLLTMNHHPLHLDAHYAQETTDFKRNVVVGNYVYSLLLGMSVPDVSGKAIADYRARTTGVSSTSRRAATTRTAPSSACSGAR